MVRMTPEDQRGLHAAVFRKTAEDPCWLGHWLKRYQEHEKLDEGQLAARLGLTMEKLVWLCMCRTPRGDRFADDIAAICQRTGAKELDIVRIVRQEQNLARLQQSQPSAPSGWLMAASDHSPGDDSPSDGEKPHD
jgi:hypothetical protein